MRKPAIVFGIAFLTLTLPVVAAAHASTGIYVNGGKLSEELLPVHVDEHTYIPVEAVTGQLGIGAAVVHADGAVFFRLAESGKQAELLRISGRDYVPLRFLAEALELKVTRDMLTGSVYVFKKPAAAGAPGVSPNRDEARDARTAPAGQRSLRNDVMYPALEPGADDLPAVHTLQATGEGLIVRADKPLEPTFYDVTRPHRIVLDFPFSRLADLLNGETPPPKGEIATNHPLIAGIEYELYSKLPSTLRVTVELKGETNYFVVLDDSGAVHLHLPMPHRTVKVAIDAGHGGHDPGSQGSDGRTEKQFTLEMARKVYRLLEPEPGITPLLIRSDDSYISPQERAAAANRAGAAIFISIHANSFTSESIRGTETYYHHPHSARLAEMMHRHVLAATGFPDRGIWKKDYVVNKETAMPSALLEIGYLSNPAEEAALWKEEMMNKVAEAIVAGIKAYIQSKQVQH